MPAVTDDNPIPTGAVPTRQRTALRDEVPPAPPLLEVRSLTKRYPGVTAIDDVSLALSAGEVVALVGENGAGKSTLLKILGGVVRPDEGAILIDGQSREMLTVRDAMDSGIALIHQELNLAASLSVAENLFLGRQPSRGWRWLPLTDRARLRRDAVDALARVELVVSPDAFVSGLDIARRQLIEIAKSLATQARILILDEPTSSLSAAEADRLLSIIEELRSQGTAILYVTHRLDEVQRIADRVIMLRDGKQTATLDKEEIAHDVMISLMVGRELRPPTRDTGRIRTGTPALEVRELRCTPTSPDVCFQIQPGEIVGFAGIVGAGRTEIAHALFGINPPASGELRIAGRPVRIRNPVDAVRAGMALVPEDRKAHGAILRLAIRSNICLATLGRLGRYGWYNRRAEQAVADRYMSALRVRAPGIATLVTALSGGNQQKVVLAKWLAASPQVFILDEPTRGIDMGAREEIYRLIDRMASEGMAVMLISSEMEEIIAVCDRVLVMSQGAIVGELSADKITEERIMELAVGANRIAASRQHA